MVITKSWGRGNGDVLINRQKASFEQEELALEKCCTTLSLSPQHFYIYPTHLLRSRSLNKLWTDLTIIFKKLAEEVEVWGGQKTCLRSYNPEEAKIGSWSYCVYHRWSQPLGHPAPLHRWTDPQAYSRAWPSAWPHVISHHGSSHHLPCSLSREQTAGVRYQKRVSDILNIWLPTPPNAIFSI